MRRVGECCAAGAEHGARAPRRLHRRRQRRPAARDHRARRRPPRAQALARRRARGKRAVPRRDDPQRPPGRRCWSAGRRPGAQGVDGATAAQRATAQAAAGLNVFRKYSGAGGLQGGVRADRRREPEDHEAREHRQDRQRPGHRRAEGHQERAHDAATASKPAGALHRRAARPRVDHAGDDPPAHALLRRQLRDQQQDPQARRRERAVVRARSPTPTATTSPSSPASGCGARTCATTTATAQITPGDGVDLNRNFPTKWGYDNEGSSPNPPARPTAAPARRPSRRRRRWTAWRAASASSSSSTTTRPPSCCSTAPAGRSPRRRPTTSSTRRWPATTPTRRSPATTRTSPPSCTRPTATPTRT